MIPFLRTIFILPLFFLDWIDFPRILKLVKYYLSKAYNFFRSEFNFIQMNLIFREEEAVLQWGHRKIATVSTFELRFPFIFDSKEINQSCYSSSFDFCHDNLRRKTRLFSPRSTVRYWSEISSRNYWFVVSKNPHSFGCFALIWFDIFFSFFLSIKYLLIARNRKRKTQRNIFTLGAVMTEHLYFARTTDHFKFRNKYRIYCLNYTEASGICVHEYLVVKYF